MSVRPGELRERLVIRTIGRTADNYGGSARSDVDTDEIWAKIEPLSARETGVYAQQQMTITHRIMVRYRTDIAHGSILRSEDQLTDYYVQAYSNPDRRKMYLELMCREGGPD